MNDVTEVAIVAAMEREVGSLIRDWTMILAHFGHVYEKGHVVLVMSGIGGKFAAEAAEEILTFRAPEVILSVGFAGALEESLTVGTVVVPTKVLHQESGRGFTIDGGEGTLLTASGIATPAQKREVASRFGAQAIDMEAAAVAEVAQIRGVRFAAIKAISDDLAFPLPAMDRFVDAEGRFRTGRFVAHAAIRPRMWPVLSQLRGNSVKASNALCQVLAKIRSAADVDVLLNSRRAQAS